MWGRAWPGSNALELCVFVRALAIETETGVRRKPDGTPECIDSEEGGDGRDGTKEVAADGDGMGREVHSGGRGEGVGGVRSEAICQVSQKGKSECIKIVITLDLKGRNNLYRGHMEDKVARRLLI